MPGTEDTIAGDPDVVAAFLVLNSLAEKDHHTNKHKIAKVLTSVTRGTLSSSENFIQFRR